jgi:hypothetical protein
MVPIIGAIYVAVRTDAAAVSPIKNSLTPGIDQITITVENNDWVSTPVQDNDPVLIIDGYTSDVNERPFLGQLCPSLNQFVLVFTSAVTHPDPPSSTEFDDNFKLTESYITPGQCVNANQSWISNIDSATAPGVLNLASNHKALS